MRSTDFGLLLAGVRSAGFAPFLLGMAATQFWGSALALSPQPEVPNKPVAMTKPDTNPEPDRVLYAPYCDR